MNMIYNSPNYCVVEFAAYGTSNGAQDSGAFEIMDKTAKREIFIAGTVAENFRRNVAELITSEPSVEDIDEFLSAFDSMMQQSMTLH
jgi:hypothetical protein